MTKAKDPRCPQVFHVDEGKLVRCDDPDPGHRAGKFHRHHSVGQKFYVTWHESSPLAEEVP